MDSSTKAVLLLDSRWTHGSKVTNFTQEEARLNPAEVVLGPPMNKLCALRGYLQVHTAVHWNLMIACVCRYAMAMVNRGAGANVGDCEGEDKIWVLHNLVMANFDQIPITRRPTMDAAALTQLTQAVPQYRCRTPDYFHVL